MGDYIRLSSSDMRDNYTKKVSQKYQKKKGAFDVIKKVFHYAREYRFYLYIAILMDIIKIGRASCRERVSKSV